MTPRELARLLRVSPDRVRAWIATGELPALNVARHRCGRPRFVILPHHLAEWERMRQAAPPAKPPRRRHRPAVVDYYAD
jgi:excisionase family DNA binding protein